MYASMGREMPEVSFAAGSPAVFAAVSEAPPEEVEQPANASTAMMAAVAPEYVRAGFFAMLSNSPIERSARRSPHAKTEMAEAVGPAISTPLDQQLHDAFSLYV
ncbi:hypothetical protein [Streptomyces capillispiralis]|uniref:hypothetical protein n=1 Tax=Streptomyces capillispiralis TaxID=68182 RepID=UPI0011A3F7BB|nr:hypothetical protein [Streptomyces capillispiralis]GHH90541.1 hypothetical protein GCM10017779_09980 [Streptomyces capillispiralis]